MASLYDVDPNELIGQIAEELKKIDTVRPPSWAAFVKTGTSKQRPPIRDDWWYIRAASILRSIAMRGPIGVQSLRVKYGSKKNRGHQKEHFFKSSGNIIRKILQQLEKSGLVKQEKKGVHKGRVITPKGISLIDKTAGRISKTANKEANKAPNKKTKESDESAKEVQKPQSKEKGRESRHQEQMEKSEKGSDLKSSPINKHIGPDVEIQDGDAENDANDNQD